MEQLELFPDLDKDDEDDKEEKLSPLDFVMVKEKNGYRLVHSYYFPYNDERMLTAEQAMDWLHLCATFNLYSVVTFSETLNLPRRRH